MNESVKNSTYEMTTYSKGGITFLPHYKNLNFFVGPGYPAQNTKIYTAAELIELGAVAKSQFLWSRGSSGDISDTQP